MGRIKRTAIAASIAALLLWAFGPVPPVGASVSCGTSWTIVSSPNPGTPPDTLYSASAVTTSDVWAAGYRSGTYAHTLIEHFDGSHWKSVPSPGAQHGSYLYGVSAVASNDVWAAGVKRAFVNPNFVYKTLIEHWDGSTWSAVPTPNTKLAYDYLFGVAAASSTDVWAVGVDGLNGNSQPQTLALHWNGLTWSKTKSQNPSTSYDHFAGVGADAAGDAWAVGGETPTNSMVDVPLIERLSTLGISVAATANVGAGSLASVAVNSSTDAWAVGALYPAPQYQDSQTLIEHWNGASWSQVASPNPSSNDAFTDVVAAGPNDVWASGWSVGGSGYKEAITAHWDGSTWTLLPAANVTGQDNVLWGITGVSGTYWAVGQHGGSSTLSEDLCP